ncbi:hypothetical protein S144_62 [Shewanella sp. phage 1/44]|uniref:hypothetical protein n=1 Tax=Shewanella sp. phage 1/44 TaxID=1458862 RepID=UPI0004F8F08B|nr:hypothetical protein S144_62 [Shewanella sp. phage 1/44]AHK11776.1 hypothetical protein S144_62 [Shewanella sp. phage 1/44]
MNQCTFDIKGDLIATGVSTIIPMSADFTHAELASIRFLDISGNQVTPTAGTFTVQGSADGVNFRNLTNSSGDSAIDATTIYTDSVALPAAMGLMKFAKIKFTGLVATGAVTFIALLHRVGK